MAKRGDPRLKRAYRSRFRDKVLARDNYTCAYCGQEADQVDHVIPISKAPELVINFDNAVASCRRCNISKGNRSEGVFLARTATPPVFTKTSLSKTVQIVPDSPFNKPETLNFDAE
jgi:5-methylcytosine-specific restriction endonuclease McrA